MAFDYELPTVSSPPVVEREEEDRIVFDEDDESVADPERLNYCIILELNQYQRFPQLEIMKLQHSPMIQHLLFMMFDWKKMKKMKKNRKVLLLFR